MACVSPLKGYRDPVTNGLVFKKTRPNQEELTVACNQCITCRVDRGLVWAVRCVHEAAMHEDGYGSCWLTLTYREEHDATEEQRAEGYFLPRDGSLTKRHPQLFFKRLRKSLPGRTVRYFYCGEYGERCSSHGLAKCPECGPIGRPHYHVCVFGHQFHDLVLFKDHQGVYTWESETLQKLWPYGFSTVGELNFETAAYTAGYCLKKITGKAAEDHYLRYDEQGNPYQLMPEFANMSTGRKRGQGIGGDWYQKYGYDIFPRDAVGVPGKGMVEKVPRYYEKMLEHENPELLEKVKAKRQEWMKQHADDFTTDRLLDRYKVAKAKQGRYKREL